MIMLEVKDGEDLALSIALVIDTEGQVTVVPVRRGDKGEGLSVSVAAVA